MIFNDIDVWRNALKKCNLRESTMPTSRGYLIEDVDTYNKIQRILDTPEMINSHKFLYNLDVEDLKEAEIAKVNNLYKLGIERGFIEDEEDEEDVAECGVGDECSDVATPAPVPVPTAPAPKLNAFTVMYSATKGGDVKTGECYSNAINPRSAKADVLAQLNRLGYENIAIIAIEAGDPDMVGSELREPEDDLSTNSFVPPAKTDDVDSSFDSALDAAVGEDDEEVDEDDILKGRKHNNHIDEEDDDKEEKADDTKEEKADDKKADDKADADKDDKADADDKDADAGDDAEDDKKDEEAAEQASDDVKDGKELDDAQKNSLRDQYKKAFKAAMLKLKFEKSFDELTLDEKIDFFTEMSKTWKNKADPSKFMSPKDMEQLNKIVIKK